MRPKLSTLRTAGRGLEGLDLLVHSPVRLSAGVRDTAGTGLRSLYSVNVRAPYIVTQRLLPHLRPIRSGGVHQLQRGASASPMNAAYAASKGFVRIGRSTAGGVNATTFVLTCFPGAPPSNAGRHSLVR